MIFCRQITVVNILNFPKSAFSLMMQQLIEFWLEFSSLLFPLLLSGRFRRKSDFQCSAAYQKFWSTSQVWPIDGTFQGPFMLHCKLGKQYGLISLLQEECSLFNKVILMGKLSLWLHMLEEGGSDVGIKWHKGKIGITVIIQLQVQSWRGS